MLDFVFKIANTSLNAVDKLDLSRQQWIGVCAGVFVVGLVCLRGFGSRSGY